MHKQSELHTVFEQVHLNVTVSKSLKNKFPEVRFFLGSGQGCYRKRKKKEIFSSPQGELTV